MSKNIAWLTLFILGVAHSATWADELRRSSWVMVPGLTLSQIYFDAAISLDKPKNRPNYEVSIVGTSALPWPDGRSVLITTLEVIEAHDKARWLFQCVNSKDANFSDTGETCYQLVLP
jgi:hypothetical protein